MIWSKPKGTTYAQIAQDDWAINTCPGPCAKASPSAHRRGHVDRAGTIHWGIIDHPARRDGVYKLLKFIGLAFNSPWRDLPKWQRLYEMNVYAHKTMAHRYRTRTNLAWSRKDRAAAWNDAVRRKVPKLRSDHGNFYMWALREFYRPKKK